MLHDLMNIIELMTIMEFISLTKSLVHPTPYQFVVKHPITPLRDQSPIELIIENNGHSLIDLRKIRSHIKCKLVKLNCDPVSGTDKISLVNMPLQSCLAPCWFQVPTIAIHIKQC